VLRRMLNFLIFVSKSKQALFRAQWILPTSHVPPTRLPSAALCFRRGCLLRPRGVAAIACFCGSQLGSLVLSAMARFRGCRRGAGASRFSSHRVFFLDNLLLARVIVEIRDPPISPHRCAARACRCPSPRAGPEN
jgi:hypothetical protein